MTIPSYCVIRGAGWNNTILRPLNDNHNLIDVSRSGSNGYQVEIADLELVGHSTGTGHGIYSDSGSSGATRFRLSRVSVQNFGGDGVHLESVWSTKIDTVDSSNNLGHQFYIGAALNAVTLENCYARGVPTAGKAGYKIDSGHVTLLNCNGIDPVATGGDYWGIFGLSTRRGDASDATAYISMIGCNVEDFATTGIELRSSNSRLDLINTSFVAPATGTVKATYTDNGSQTYPVFWSPSSSISTKGAAWANALAIHTLVGANMIKIGVGDHASAYNENGATAMTIPQLTGDDGANGLRAYGGILVSSDLTTHTVIRKHLSATATWNPASIANGGAFTSTTVPVTGAVVGDTVSVGFSIAVPAGVLLVGAVTSADTVTVSLVNNSATNPVDLASGTIRADVWQH